MPTTNPRRYTLAEAAELRDPAGRRRFGSQDTLRRRIKDGSLQADLVSGMYLVTLSNLQSVTDRHARVRARASDPQADLLAAAQRVADSATPISAAVAEACSTITVRSSRVVSGGAIMTRRIPIGLTPQAAISLQET